MFSEDPTAFVADLGSPVIFGRYSTLAIFDEPDQEILGGRAQSTRYCILYPTAALPGLVNASTVLIGIGFGWGFDSTKTRMVYSGNCAEPDSGTFKVIGTPNLKDDGVFSEAMLERVT